MLVLEIIAIAKTLFDQTVTESKEYMWNKSRIFARWIFHLSMEYENKWQSGVVAFKKSVGLTFKRGWETWGKL